MTFRSVCLFFTVAIASAAVARADMWSEPARYRVEYRVDLPAISAQPGQHVRVWVPYPATNADQTVQPGESESPWPYRLTRDALGNQIVYAEGEAPAARPLVIRAVVQRSPSHGVRRDAIAADPMQDPGHYTAPIQLIPLDGIIRQLAEQEGKGIDGTDAKAEAFYRYVVRTMRYDKSGDGWGRGDAVWACTNQRGNCTDFHSLFMGMAMSQGIPARFSIGFPVPGSEPAGDIPGYHCWAEYYSPARGWVPLDASEAKKSGQTDAYFGALPNDRIQYTTGRDLRLEPPQAGPPLNYFIFPYVEVDGAPVSGVKPTMHYERLAGSAS